MDREHFYQHLHDVKEKFVHMGRKLLGDHEKENHLKAERDTHELDEEMGFYQKEHPAKEQERVLKESGGQDISAI